MMANIVRWVVLAAVVAAGGWLWVEKQWVVDSLAVAQYQPSGAIATITQTVDFTEEGKFTFYATQPALLANQAFNQECERQEGDSPILGCYSGRRIYLFDVTNKRLDNIEEVTAAHEMLHAVYERLPDSERHRLTSLLETAYEKVKTPELEKRMAYYQRTEPGERINELHSIIGTEFTNIGSELETYYAKYFKDRQKVISLHRSVESIFTSLSSKAKSIAEQANQLATSINANTAEYNSESAQLNQDIQSFNNRARRPGGFSSSQEFGNTRAGLLARTEQLQSLRQQITTDIAAYKELVAQLQAINQETESLNQSLDSTLAPAPKL